MLERWFERALYGSRWLLAPFFAALALGLFALLARAALHVWTMFSHLLQASETRVMLDLLALIDLTLVAVLAVVVALAGYENFVSKIDVGGDDDRLNWVSATGFSELKAKLMSTIVAISAIRLLETFMEVGATRDRDAYFQIGIHLTFVASAIGLALAERLGGRKDAH